MIRVVPPLTIRMYPDYGPNEIFRGHIRDHFFGYSAGFEHFKTSRIPPRMFQNPSRIFARTGRENRMHPCPNSKFRVYSQLIRFRCNRGFKKRNSTCPLYPYHTTTTNPTNCQESRNTWVRGCIVGNSRSS